MLPLLTFSTLLFEISLTRIFGYVLPYHFAPVAISLAMLGLGAGSCLRLSSLRGRDPDRVLSSGLSLLALCFAVQVPLLSVAPAPWTLIAAALAPLLVLGVLVSQFYGAAGAERAHRTYLFDLMGAAAACFASVGLLDAVGASGVCFLLAVLASAAAVFSSPKSRPLAFSAAAVSLALAGSWFGGLLGDPLGSSPAAGGKPLQSMMAREGGAVVDSRWSAVGRADLYEDGRMPNIKWIYYDAMNSTFLVREPDTPQRRAFLQGLFANLPFALVRPADVMLIGPGGGLETHMALMAGARRVEAVELNGAVIRLVRRQRAFAGPVYEREGVSLAIGEGRRHLMSSRRRYDLIQMALVLTATAQSGSYALAEGFLYTVEAHRLYLERLKPGGMLAMIDDSPERSLRQFLTALSALKSLGLEESEALGRLIVVDNPGRDSTGYRRLLLVSGSVIPPGLTRRLAAACRSGGFEPLWLPGHPGRGPFAEIASRGAAAFVAGHRLELSPPSDDHPYFFNFAKGPYALAQVLSPIVLPGVAALLAAFAAAWGLRRRLGPRPVKPAALACLLGVGFMLVEIGLLQKLTLAAGGPTRVLAVVLCSLLVWCGVGSRLGESLQRRFDLGPAPFFLAAACAAAATVLLLRGAYLLPGISSGSLRVAATALLLAPVGLALGTPFPALLKSRGDDGEWAAAALWGLNGLSSVAGSALAMTLALLFGIEAAVLAGAGVYLLGALIALSRDGRLTGP